MSSNSRYSVAVHILLMLEDPGGDWVTSEWIAGSVNTNPVVIRRLLAQLQSVGLVDGQKGAHGGYRLARPSGKITMWEVYEAMREDGPFGLHPSVPNKNCPIGGKIQKHLRTLYDATEQSMQRVLDKTTLGSLRRQITSA
jgi:Rrf2 family protein